MPDDDVLMPEPGLADAIRLHCHWDTMLHVATGKRTRRLASDWETMPFLPGHKVRCRQEIGLNTRDTTGTVIGVRTTAQGVDLVSVAWERTRASGTYTADELMFESEHLAAQKAREESAHA